MEIKNTINGDKMKKLNEIHGNDRRFGENLKNVNSELMNFRKTCEYLGIAPSSLYKLTCRNLIPHHKPTGKVLFFFKKEIDDWIKGML